MGWIGLDQQPKEGVVDYFEAMWENPSNTPGSRYRVLASAFVGRFVLYQIIERYFKADETGPARKIQFANVTRIRYQRGSDDQFMYELIDESAGPSERRCPKSLLKLLKTPGYNAYSRGWRKACWQDVLHLTYSQSTRDLEKLYKKGWLYSYDLLQKQFALYQCGKLSAKEYLRQRTEIMKGAQRG